VERQVATATSFRALEAEGSERQEWLSILDSCANREVFAHPDYLNLYRKTGDKPICLVYTCPGGRVIHPVILRDLRATDFWGSAGEEVYDTIAPPYGYGGPFVDGEVAPFVLLEPFFEEYQIWARSHGVISEYNILSPKEDFEIPYPGEVEVKAPTVVRTLGKADEVWSDYKASVRGHVRTAERAGVYVEVDQTGDRVGDFLEIYTETMLRRGATANYFLTMEFLEELNRTLGGYYTYFHALLDGRVVSSELVLLSHDSTFFFRGGTRSDSLRVGPNLLLKHHVILWSIQQGKRTYLLGGGNSADDTLYHYKLSFAPRGARDLKVGKWIIDPNRYWEAVEARRAYERARGAPWAPKAGYFPEYRAMSAKCVES
jgi:Acetyltransferase (GNAT) domain